MGSDELEVKLGSSSSEQNGNTTPLGLLHLPQQVYAEIRAHGEESYPDECCGALLGHPTPQGWRVLAAVRARNARTDAPCSRYEIAPVELVVIEREARDLNLEIAGFYHSHPDHPAQWSPTDLAEAHWLGCCYLITAVVEGKAVETNSFLLTGVAEEEKRFVAQSIRIDRETADPISI